MSNKKDEDNQEQDNSVFIWKIKKLIETLQKARG